MKTNVILNSENGGDTNTLVGILADEFILYVQIRRARWKVKGSHVLRLHKMFQDQYRKIGMAIDDVAERLRSLGHSVPTTLREFLQLTHLNKGPDPGDDDKDLLKYVLDSHETILMNLRKHVSVIDQKADQVSTSDFITSLMMTHERLVWILLSHLAD